MEQIQHVLWSENLDQRSISFGKEAPAPEIHLHKGASFAALYRPTCPLSLRDMKSWAIMEEAGDDQKLGNGEKTWQL